MIVITLDDIMAIITIVLLIIGWLVYKILNKLSNPKGSDKE